MISDTWEISNHELPRLGELFAVGNDADSSQYLNKIESTGKKRVTNHIVKLMIEDAEQIDQANFLTQLESSKFGLFSSPSAFRNYCFNFPSNLMN